MPLSRREILELLIRRLPDAIAADNGDVLGGIAGGDERQVGYGPLWHEAPGTWRELTRCLRLLAEKAPVSSRHLHARYWQGETSRRPVRFARSRDGLGDPLGLAANEEIVARGGALNSRFVLDCVVHRWPSWVRRRKSDAAVDLLLRLWRGPLMLPRSLG